METWISFQKQLQEQQYTWLVTGAAGFIGSHLVESLLKQNQKVIGVDNFSTGHYLNIEHVQKQCLPTQWEQFIFQEGDIRDFQLCVRLCSEVDFVLHQAALGSVPRSLIDPLQTHQNNINGFLNLLIAARDRGVKQLVYASSSSVYGDYLGSPKIEQTVGNVLSPYALTKKVNEEYATIFARCYHLNLIGLRYFNVFGKRQDPQGAYAAVIPRWIMGLLNRTPVDIYGDGETTRDFTYINNVIQANLRAALTTSSQTINRVYNVAVGESTSLNTLFFILKKLLSERFPQTSYQDAIYCDFREGDIRHSLADITKIKQELGYKPTETLYEGLKQSLDWYIGIVD